MHRTTLALTAVLLLSGCLPRTHTPLRPVLEGMTYYEAVVARQLQDWQRVRHDVHHLGDDTITVMMWEVGGNYETIRLKNGRVVSHHVQSRY